jgi:outer membrane protein assembly factor BamA
VTFAAWALAAAVTCAAPQAGPAEVIAAVRVHGNYLTPSDEVVALAGIVIGAPFEDTTIADVTARLRRTGRFVDVRVEQRFASIADPSRILVVIVVDEGPVRIRMPDEAGGEPEVVPRRGLRNFLYLPILDAEDGYGLTYGVRLARVGVGGDTGRLSIPLSWGGTKRAGVEYDRTFERGPFSRVAIGGALQRRTNPAFDEDDGRRRVWGRAERHLGPVRLGGGVGWEHVSFGAADDELRTSALDVAYDTRLSPLLPRNAVYARAGVERIDFASGGDAVRTTLDGRAYLGLFGQTVLEARLRREDANRPLPPYLKSLLGGWSSLRGFEAGAFAGDTMVNGSLELHVPLNAVLSAGKVGISVFGDAGAVHDDGQRLQDQRARTGAGGSLWVTLAAFKMSLAVARGRGAGTRVNFGGGFEF